jgi:hypothetical protein
MSIVAPSPSFLSSACVALSLDGGWDAVNVVGRLLGSKELIELPQPRRQSPSRLQGLPTQSSGVRLRDAGSSALEWSPADELAALETVWESRCQDATSRGTPLQLPNRPSPRQARGRVQRSLCQRNRLTGAYGRLAS